MIIWTLPDTSEGDVIQNVPFIPNILLVDKTIPEAEANGMILYIQNAISEIEYNFALTKYEIRNLFLAISQDPEYDKWLDVKSRFLANASEFALHLSEFHDKFDIRPRA